MHLYYWYNVEGKTSPIFRGPYEFPVEFICPPAATNVDETGLSIMPFSFLSYDLTWMKGKKIRYAESILG